MSDHEWDLLLDRYLDGRCSSAEEAYVQQELARRGEAAAIAALRQGRPRAAEAEHGAPPGEAISPVEVTAALARLDQRLVDAGLRPAVTPKLRLRLADATSEFRRRSGPAYGLRAAAAAAAALVLLAGGAAAWFMSWTPRAPVVASMAATRAFVTARGQRGVFQLIDGTQVILNVDSRLRIPANYGATRRDVTLDGEAYFVVVHDAARPFAVHTAHGVARDIGTKFGVRAYRDDAAEWVVVAEGVVGVAAATNAAVERRLTAGQLAAVSATGVVAVADSADVDRELAWTRGELHFTNVPLGVALRRLGQWYDVDVQLADSALADRPVSGVYAGESLQQVLTLITTAVGAEFEWHGKRVVILAPTGGRRP